MDKKTCFFFKPGRNTKTCKVYKKPLETLACLTVLLSVEADINNFLLSFLKNSGWAGLNFTV